MKKTLLMIALFAAGLAVGVWWARPVAEGGESPNAEEPAETQSRADEAESSSGEEGEDCQSEVQPQEGEKPLAKVTAKVGKATGAISVSFTSKKGDKAKYAVELVCRGAKLFAGHVTRTWKGGKISCTASGTAEVK